MEMINDQLSLEVRLGMSLGNYKSREVVMDIDRSMISKGVWEK